MRRYAFGFLAVVLLAGCADSAREAKVNEAPPTADVDQTEPSIDAAQLLASTLETAKVENKRVMVHLGAPG